MHESLWKKQGINDWMHDGVNQLRNTSMSEHEEMDELVKEQINAMKECERVNARINEWMSEGRDKGLIEGTNTWTNEGSQDWTKEWINECISKNDILDMLNYDK